MQAFEPEIIVPVGNMAISEVLLITGKPLTEVIGQTFTVNPFDSLRSGITAIPLPHPSGRSTWVRQHADLLETALQKLRSNLTNPS